MQSAVSPPWPPRQRASAACRSLRFVVVVLVLGLPSGLIAQPSERRTLEVDDFFALSRVSSPEISPDGRWLAYTVSDSDLERDETETALWMMPLGGGEAIRMTAPGSSASRPRFSPNGRLLSFLAARNDDESQVWALNLQGGDAQALTDVSQGIDGYEWSPDASRLILIVRDPDPKQDDKEDAEATDDKPEPWVIDRRQFKRDGDGYLDRLRSHLYVFDLGTKTTTQITSGDYDDSEPVWSPDGRLVAFTSNRTDDPDANGNTDIWLVSADNSDQGQTLRQVTTNPGSDSSPAWSPDGELLAYVTVTRPDLIWYATRYLALSPAGGGEAKLLTGDLDRHVSSPRFSPDGRSVVFLLEDSGEHHLARIGANGRNLERLTQGERSVQEFALGQDEQIVVLASEPWLPAEIFGLDGGGLERRTKVNDELLAQLRLGAVTGIRFPSRDGTEIEGFLVKPPDYDDKLRYPTLLRIHGGPVGQYDFRFSFEAQLFAAHGYVVVMANPRGSSGYGQDFSLAIWQDWGNKDFEDVMAAVDHVVEAGYADPHRLGVGGWSYGGILTNYVITKTERFEAAITGASEVLYVANYGHDHYQLQWELELGLPWENRELWERISPFNQVDKITTPTLIMGGEKDWNVPILNSEQLFQALRRLGRTTELVVYPGESHGIRRPSFQKDRFERYLEWYGTWVKGERKNDGMSAAGSPDTGGGGREGSSEGNGEENRHESRSHFNE